MKILLGFILGLLVAIGSQAVAETFIETGRESTILWGSEGTRIEIMPSGNYYLSKDGQIVDDGYVSRQQPPADFLTPNPC